MRVIFLDIDGVLNSGRTARAFQGSVLMRQLDPVAVGMLRNVVEKSGAEIVLSSTWRLSENWREETARCLCGAGWPVDGRLDSIFLDRTPKYLGINTVRGDEIQKWLEDNPEYDDYIIIDDDSDMLESQMDRFINVDYQIGLSVDNWNRICEIWPEVGAREGTNN